jgi:peptidoglycan/LPS O-acetylase OafA/YrhL
MYFTYPIANAGNSLTTIKGLRGIAALYVLASHLVLCYARHIVNACCAPNSSSPTIFQLPIFRLVASGHSWVAVFFILLGFVNALKPIKLARSGLPEQGAANLANGAFGRICRLILPATAATALSWTLCQMGFFEAALESDAFWLHSTTPSRSSNPAAAMMDLLRAIKSTWSLGQDNPYDQPQWAMIYLLQGSVMVITALTLTVNMTVPWRVATILLLCFWSLDWSWELRDRK